MFDESTNPSTQDETKKNRYLIEAKAKASRVLRLFGANPQPSKKKTQGKQKQSSDHVHQKSQRPGLRSSKVTAQSVPEDISSASTSGSASTQSPSGKKDSSSRRVDGDKEFDNPSGFRIINVDDLLAEGGNPDIFHPGKLLPQYYKELNQNAIVITE
jgi:hypothetical protein